MSTRPHLTSFDKTVLGVIACLLLATLALIWRGDQVGLQIARLSPAANSQQVSTQARLRVTFNQEIADQTAVPLTITPPLAGAIRWEGSRTLVFEPENQWAQATTYTVTIPAGVAGRQGRELLKPFVWQFHTSQPRLLYLAWDASRSGNQLFVIAPSGGQATPLTETPLNVLDYAVAPDGQVIAFSSTRDDSGSDLWLMDATGANQRLLLACPEGACSQPVWSPDGRRLIYERHTFLQPGAPVGPPRLWWLDVTSGETTAVFQDSQWLGLGARFSADGQWLSYITPQSQEVQVYNLTSGQNITVRGGAGEPTAWHPTDNILLTTQVDVSDTDLSISLAQLDVTSERITNLSGDSVVNDSWPIYAPDGEWIAFTRKGAQTNEGKQVWLMQSDGTEAKNVTQRPELHFGPPAWSPDGRFLTFQGYTLAQSDQPSIWVYDLVAETLQLITTPGIRPTWLP